jgi:hypothetical protein
MGVSGLLSVNQDQSLNIQFLDCFNNKKLIDAINF